MRKGTGHLPASLSSSVQVYTIYCYGVGLVERDCRTTKHVCRDCTSVLFRVWVVEKGRYTQLSDFLSSHYCTPIYVLFRECVVEKGQYTI